MQHSHLEDRGIGLALLNWYDAHKRLMAKRARRLTPSNPIYTHELTSVWLRLLRLAWSGIKALFKSFLNIFTKTFWMDMWADTKWTFSPSSPCGVCLNAYTCGLVCNPKKERNDPPPARGNGDAFVTQNPMTMPKTSDLQRPLPTVVVGEMV